MNGRFQRTAAALCVSILVGLNGVALAAQASRSTESDVDRALAQLDDPRLDVRCEAAVALLGVAGSSAQVLQGIEEAVLSDPELDRWIAAQVLFRSTPAHSSSVDELVTALGHSDRMARAAAAYQIALLKPHNERITSALRDRLADEDKHPRNFAALALAMIGPDAAAAVPELIAAAGDPGDGRMNFQYVQASAALALGRIGPKAAAAEPLLVELLEGAAVRDLGRTRPSNAEEQRAAAAFALGAIGARSDACRRALVAAASEEDTLLRFHAIRALTRLDGASDSLLLRRNTSHPDDGLRHLAQHAINGNHADDPHAEAGWARHHTDGLSWADALQSLAPTNPKTIRQSSTLALAFLVSEETPSLRTLILPASSTDEQRKRTLYFQALGQINRQAVPILLACHGTP